MAANPKMANAVVDGQASALATLANNGYLRIYDGSQPASADTGVTSQVLLAELRLNATAFGAPSSGVITANAITPEDAALASGTATWYRVLKSDGTTPLWDNNIGTSSAGLIMATTTITAGMIVGVDTLTHTVTK